MDLNGIEDMILGRTAQPATEETSPLLDAYLKLRRPQLFGKPGEFESMDCWLLRQTGSTAGREELDRVTGGGK